MHKVIVTLLTLIFILLIIGAFSFLIVGTTFMNEQSLQITVKDKFIKRVDDTDTYMVVDTDNNTYKITDQFFRR